LILAHSYSSSKRALVCSINGLFNQKGISWCRRWTLTASWLLKRLNVIQTAHEYCWGEKSPRNCVAMYFRAALDEWLEKALWRKWQRNWSGYD